MTSVISFTWQLVGNNTPQMTLLNENGVQTGTKQVKISTKNTVPVGQEEMDLMNRAFINDEDVVYVWRTGRLQYKSTGKFGSLQGGSEVNRPNTFDSDFDGFLDVYQAAPVTP